MTVPALTNKANLAALLGTDTIPTDEKLETRARTGNGAGSRRQDGFRRTQLLRNKNIVVLTSSVPHNKCESGCSLYESHVDK